MRRAALLMLFLAFIACAGESTEPNTTSGTDGGDGLQLTIEGRSFGSTPTLAPGETMTILNLDSVRHTFSSGDDSWPTVEIGGNSEAEFVVPEALAPGSYVFFCEVHSDMGGSLTISG